jgi:UDPglucose 6-dehydrogenase
MAVGVVGTGYVGLVAATCLSDTGQYVLCAEKDPRKVETLKSGIPTIYETGLAELMKRNIEAGRLTFTEDLKAVVEKAGILFIAVGTPPNPDGSVDLSQVLEVATTIARTARDHRIVVMKSTVPVGTHARIENLFEKEASVGIDYVSNPEFLKEGNAIDDFTKPDRVVIGASNPQAAKSVAHLYSAYMRQSNRIIITDPATAELAKYAANTALATRIAFMNEIARLADKCGANIEDVRRCVGADRRIGSAFLFPGIGYGGFCFPKDVQALTTLGREKGAESLIADATHRSNLAQVPYYLEIVDRHFRGHYDGRKIAAWGLAYKARTDDVRMSPAVAIVRSLAEKGADVVAHDPQAMPKARQELGDAIHYGDNMYDILQGAEALLILTDWQEFRNPDFDHMRTLMRSLAIIDGRNLYDLQEMAATGFIYHSIGRPCVLPG